MKDGEERETMCDDGGGKEGLKKKEAAVSLTL